MPRQDQLQDMIKDYNTTILIFYDGKNWKCVLTNNNTEGINGITIISDSLEKLWFCIVMFLKYSKRWKYNKWMDI